MRARRILATGTVALTAAAALTGCASAAGDEPVTLTYWATNEAASLTQDEEILAPALERFTEKTGIEVDLEVISWDDYYNRILTAVSSGEGPDVLNIGNTWAATLQQTGAFVPFEGEALDAIGGSDRFVSTAWETAGAAGLAPSSVPLYAQVYSLYYNPTLFAAAGITEPPATWADFVAAAEKLTVDTDGDGTVDQYGVTIPAGFVSQLAHFAFILGQQQGATFFDEDGAPVFASDEMVTAVTSLVDLMGSDGVISPSDAEMTSSSEARDRFINGEAAMVLTMNPQVAFDAAGFEDWDVADVPIVDPLPAGGAPIETMIAGTNISVFGETAHQDEALQLVEFLTSPDEQVYLTSAFSSLPVVTEAYEAPEIADDPMLVTRQRILAEHAAAFPTVPQIGEAETLIGEAIKTLMSRAAIGESVTEADIREALETASDQLSASS